MTKEQARRHAYGQVFAIIQSAIDSGSDFEVAEDDADSREKAIAHLDKIAQRYFELWKATKS